MTPDEFAQLKALEQRSNMAAIRAATMLMTLVARGAVTSPTMINASNDFKAAMSEVQALLARVQAKQAIEAAQAGTRG
jgi:hypothetical protein